MSTTTERVGRYQILEPLGAGPCGIVSRAKVFGVAGFERQFAVKRFHPELTITTALAQALSAAARAYGSLEHPRIARMSEFGVAQGQTFTAVELVTGLDAARLVAEARLSGVTLASGGALALVSQAARAVGYAHGRGLSHLGLSPTNVIVTVDGDIKITDFGILASGMPQRPIDVARLQQRIPYLAPEQIANEATSAATDVFALGVIAYELVTGTRAYPGPTPQQVAHAIMQGPPPEPPLPRPIVRVLQRCLARSPFERFPDARALADALDAALRVAPVPGSRRDIGIETKAIVDRLATLHDSEMSGMVALHVGTGPVANLAAHDDGPTRDMAALDRSGPEATRPDMVRPPSTFTGLPPPPIPVPSGIGSPASALSPAHAGAPNTLLGIAHAKVPSAIPSIKSPSTVLARTVPRKVPSILARGSRSDESTVPEPAPAPAPPAAPEASRPESVLEMEILESAPDDGALDAADLLDLATMPEPVPAASTSRASRPTRNPAEDVVAVDDVSPSSPIASAVHAVGAAGVGAVEAVAARVGPVAAPSSPPAPLEVGNRAETEGVLIKPAPAALSSAVTGDVPGDGPRAVPPVTAGRPRRSKAPVIVLASLLGAAGLAVGGWQLYERVIAPDEAGSSGSGVVATATADAATARPAPADAAAASTTDAAGASATADAAIATATADAATATATPGDAATPATVDAVAATPDDMLVVTSTPKGAHVYLDGADTGTTPLKLPGSPDRHTIALLLPGYELHTAEVPGSGAVDVALKETTPVGGPAGIKVTRCKDKDRYYVFVDGRPTGMMCPTERIETDLGPHTVEVYDAVTETRKKYEIVVKDTRLSHRVKLE